MAGKKPMTKAQIVSYFAKKFDLSKKAASSVIDEMAALGIAEPREGEGSRLSGLGDC